MTAPLTLTATDLGLAGLLLLVNAGISIAFQLGVERALFISALRLVVQLSLIGGVLRTVFASGSLWLTAGAGLIMVLVAAVEAGQRQTPRFKGWITEGLGLATLLTVGTLATLYAVGVVIGPSPTTAPGLLTSFEPRHVLPILGMVLGNTLTSVSLTLATLLDLVRRERGAIEGQLALGATIRSAFSGVLRRTLKTAMMPVINAMAVAGIVTLPGMMTGQILAGADPGDAAKSQIMIMFVISGAAGLGALLSALGAMHLLTDPRQRLRLDRLATPARG